MLISCHLPKRGSARGSWNPPGTPMGKSGVWTDRLGHMNT